MLAWLIGIAGAFVLGCLLTWVARYVATALKFVDQPGGRKKHHRPTPLLGGVAFLLTICLVFAGFLFIESPILAGFSMRRLLSLLACCGAICAVGVWDDRWPMRARTKFCFQVAASMIFVLIAQPVQAIHVLGVEVSLGPLAPICGVLWMLICLNAVNLVDGMDGMAGSVGLTACCALAAIAGANGHPAVAFVLAISGASLFGFLCHNAPPAKIFLGDSGSLSLGFLLGGLSLLAATNPAGSTGMVTLCAVLFLPFLDLTAAMVRRTLNGRGIATPDRQHVHHRLRARGLSVVETLVTIVAICTISGGTAVISDRAQSDMIAIGAAVSLIMFMAASRLFCESEVWAVGRLFSRKTNDSSQDAATSSNVQVYGKVDQTQAESLAEPVAWTIRFDSKNQSGQVFSFEATGNLPSAQREHAADAARQILALCGEAMVPTPDLETVKFPVAEESTAAQAKAA